MDCKMGSEHCVNARQMVFKWLTLGLFRAQALNIYTGKEMLFPPSIFSITDQTNASAGSASHWDWTLFWREFEEKNLVTIWFHPQRIPEFPKSNHYKENNWFLSLSIPKLNFLCYLKKYTSHNANIISSKFLNICTFSFLVWRDKLPRC